MGILAGIRGAPASLAPTGLEVYIVLTVRVCMCMHVCIYIYIYTHTIYIYVYTYIHTYIHIWLDDRPAPWCFSTMQCFPKPETFTKSEGLGSQNLKHSPNLRARFTKRATFTKSEGRGSQNLQHSPNLYKTNQTVNIEEICKIVRFPGRILHPMGWFVRL